MRFIISTLITVVCYSIFATCVNAQNKNISGEFNNTKFPDFVNAVEANTSYHFYYDESELDSFTVNAKLVNESLDDALKQVFSGTNFRYSVDPLDHVFIVKNKPLQTTLAADFFSPDKKTNGEEEEVSPIENVKNKKTKNAFTENKLFEIGSKSSAKKSNAILTGFVTDIKNGEALPGASIYIDSAFTGLVTDQFGYYSVTVKPGIHTLEVNSIGMKEALRHITVYADGKLNIEMKDEIPRLKNVIITAEKRSNIRSTQMGIDRLSVKAIKDIPVVFGEADILRVVLTLPGVTSVGEASTGFNVRGGSADQNLILFDGTTVY
ncbi:MAG: carboxypeptidase-like regulatory domain-containing protein, partial [Ginsengibacter sp.]